MTSPQMGGAMMPILLGQGYFFTKTATNMPKDSRRKLKKENKTETDQPSWLLISMPLSMLYLHA